jgi:hypothetical protein
VVPRGGSSCERQSRARGARDPRTLSIRAEPISYSKE